MNQYTICDVAKIAGVAKSTVSRVINNNGYVSPETREKINNVIKEIQYIPSAAARSLSKQKNNIIAVCIPEADNPFYGEILNGISDIAEQNDIAIIFCNTDNKIIKEERFFNAIKEHRVSGLIISPAIEYSSNDLVLFKKNVIDLGIPVLILDRKIENLEFDGIYFDNYNGAYMATNELIKAGHKKIAVITGDLSLKLGRERLNGFRNALQDHGITLNPKYIYQGDFTTDTAYRISKDFLKSNDIPEAVFLSNNLTAMGFFKALYKSELKLCVDICCIGFDYVPALDILNIPYSYVERDTINMGRIAAKMLLDRLNTNLFERREYVLPAKIILNGSEHKIKNI